MDWLKIRSTLLRFAFLATYVIIISPLALLGAVCRIAFQGFATGWSTMDALGTEIAAWASGRKIDAPDSPIALLTPAQLERMSRGKGPRK